MEKDDEVKGSGNSLDFGAREYDPRLGRWFARDPQFKKYPDISPYAFAGNNPIYLIDPDGEEVTIHGADAKATVAALQKVTSIILFIDANGKLAGELPQTPSTFSKLDIALLNAIKDETVNVNLYTTDAEFFDSKDGTKNIAILIGGFEGSEIIDGKVETTQLFNLGMAMKVEDAGLSTAGGDAAHEIIESYSAGKDDPGGDYNSGFQSAHAKALEVDPTAIEIYPNKNSKTGASGVTDGKGTQVDLIPKDNRKKFIKPKKNE
jgi:RHS repeat-associated protein